MPYNFDNHEESYNLRDPRRPNAGRHGRFSVSDRLALESELFGARDSRESREYVIRIYEINATNPTIPERGPRPSDRCRLQGGSLGGESSSRRHQAYGAHSNGDRRRHRLEIPPNAESWMRENLGQSFGDGFGTFSDWDGGGGFERRADQRWTYDDGFTGEFDGESEERSAGPSDSGLWRRFGRNFGGEYAAWSGMFVGGDSRLTTPSSPGNSHHFYHPHEGFDTHAGPAGLFVFMDASHLGGAGPMAAPPGFSGNGYRDMDMEGTECTMDSLS